jgi:RND family efflux transporter MFP subunit
MEGKSLWVRAGIPVVVVLVGLIVFLALVKSRPEALRIPQEDRATLVEVMVLASSPQTTRIQAQGTVIPARQLHLLPQVSGRVTFKNDRLVPGGQVRQGDVLVRIDARDYELAVRQQRSTLQRAEVELEIERGRAKVAEREYALSQANASMPAGEGDGPNPLVLRKPQLQAAEAGLLAARSGLEQAELALERTIVRAPLNAVVQGEDVEVGQVAGPQGRLATLVGTDQFWVQASVRLDKLEWIRFPEAGAKEPHGGSTVRVSQAAGRQNSVFEGRVIRLLPDLEQAGRMARLIVAVDNPLRLGNADAGDGLPLLLGSYVELDIEGRNLGNVIEVPRSALREGDRVFVMNAEDRLEIRSLEVLWRSSDSVLAQSGVRAGERLITSRIGTPTEGMPLRVATRSAASDRGNSAEGAR